jgi:hypothetical protein
VEFANAAFDGRPVVLNLFCMPEGDAFRVHVAPRWIPRYLHPVLDRNGEAFPVLLDWEDLERCMAENHVTIQKRVSRAGSVELTARGPAAQALGVWLATALASGVRAPNAEESTPSRERA